jgi:16S rRNA (guanine527-N7)-methyltransferase
VGAIGPAPLEQHIDHAHGFGDLIASIDPAPTSILDLGSGGGIPGLVLAERFPSAIVTLLDGRTGRVELLREMAEELDWGYRLQIVGDRAERFARDPGSREAYQFVVARGFSRPAVTAECGAPLLAPDGVLVVSEPPDESQRADRWNLDHLAVLGLELEPTSGRSYHYVYLRRVGPCPEQYPRRVGIPEKRPLF